MAKKKRSYIDEYMNYPQMMTKEEIEEREKEVEELKKKRKMKIKNGNGSPHPQRPPKSQDLTMTSSLKNKRTAPLKKNIIGRHLLSRSGTSCSTS